VGEHHEQKISFVLMYQYNDAKIAKNIPKLQVWSGIIFKNWVGPCLPALSVAVFSNTVICIF
jgi:hypothetical protein